MSNKELVSLIVPCYSEEVTVEIFYNQTINVIEKLPQYDFEFLFVDDGSKDKTLEVIKKLSKLDERVKYLSFSRNFGKESAMYAGFNFAKGDYVATMDADLQDPPELIPIMNSKLSEFAPRKAPKLLKNLGAQVWIIS